MGYWLRVIEASRQGWKHQKRQLAATWEIADGKAQERRRQKGGLPTANLKRGNRVEWKLKTNNKKLKMKVTWQQKKNLKANFRLQMKNELLSLLSDSNQRPRDYKSRALANWAKEAGG